MKTESVFIVDDDPTLQYFYRELLEFGGFEVAGIAENGEEAVSMFKSFSDKPKVILMDHRMPIKSGIEASKEILLIDQNIKIIFLSADITVKEEAYSIGVFGFWDKPFMISPLIDDIKKAFESFNSLGSN